MPQSISRCAWAKNAGPEEILYHDTEWGVPCFDDRRQFEFLVLESAQAGLSWRTILLKRQGYKACFANFDPVKVALFGIEDVERLLLDARIIRNRKKIEAAINNAQRFLEVQAKHGSFCNFFWNFVDGQPVMNKWREITEVPATTPLSDKIAKEFKQLGFKFLGSTTLYAHMQATGLVNDHLIDCFRHQECCLAK